MEANFLLYKGLVYICQGKPAQAMEELLKAALISENFPALFQANRLAYHSAASRLAGDGAEARRLAEQAVDLISPNDFGNTEIIVEELYWWCYRAMAPDESDPDIAPISDDLWQILELARQAMFTPVETMSDAGLRRGYLHRVRYRRELVREWLKWAPTRVGVEQIEAFTSQVQRPGRLKDVFQRLLKVGVRLNAQRDASRLPAEIVEQVAELTGAERIALVLLDSQGVRRSAELLLPIPPYQAMSGTFEAPPDPDSFLVEIELWLEQAASLRQGFLRLLNPERALAEQHSLLVAPLISQSRLVGMIYADLTGCFGRFEQEDLDLLVVLANQSAVAVENADWSATLEHRVVERTMELEQSTRMLQASNQSLEQRSGELTILNSVGEAMAKTLDVKTVAHIVGDKVRDIFDADSVSIMLLDPQTNLIHTQYEFDKGEGGYVEYIQPFPLGIGLTSKVINSRQPLMLGTIEEQEANGAYIAPELIDQGSGETNQSWLGVPIIVSDRVLGIVGLGDYQPHAFNENHLRLLQTLSSNMGVAIENAHLFQAEQQRAAELAIINSVQAGLAEKLDLQAIYDLVGGKIRDIFDAQVVMISQYDHENDLVHNFFTIEKGQRLYPQPWPIPQLSKQIIQTRQPVLLNTLDEIEQSGMPIMPDTESAQSFLVVPLIRGGEVIGYINLQNLDRENAFNQADVHLLTTLANAMSVALENARLFDETQHLLNETEQRAAELAIINSVQAALAAELNIQGIYGAVGDKIREIFHQTDIGIRIYDPQTELLHFPYTYENGQRIEIESMPLGDKGCAVHVLRTRETLVFNENLEAETEKYGSYTLPGTQAEKSSVYVPLVAGDQARGLINLIDMHREHAFSESDVRLLQTLANSMSVALENARLFDETQRLLKETERRSSELAILNSISSEMAKTLDVQTLTRNVGEKMREIFDVDSVIVMLLDSSKNLIQIAYEYDRNEGGNIEDIVEPFPLGTGLASKVITTHLPLLLGSREEQTANGAYFPPELMERSSKGATSQSWLGVPIMAGDRVMGVVALADYKPQAFTENNLTLLQTLSANLGVALENARLFQSEQQRAAELAIINSVQAALAAELNIQGIYDTVGDKIRQIFHNTDLNIRIYDPLTNLEHFPYLYENGERIILPPDPLPELGISAHVIRTHETVVINENMEQAVQKYGSYTMPGTNPEKSSVFVPLLVGDQVRGLINLSNMESENAFSESDVRLLQTMASSMSVALENARLFDETQRLLEETEQRAAELQIINSVQQGLASELDFQAIVDLVGDKLREVFATPDLGICWYDEKADLIHYLYIYYHGERLTITASPPVAGGSFETIKKTRQPVVVKSVQENHTVSLETLEGTDRSKSMVAVPIISSDRVLGLIELENYERENAFEESELRLLTTIAASLGAALENAHLFDETQRRSREMAALAEVGRDISATLDLTTVMERIAAHAKELLQGDNSAIYLPDASGHTFHAIAALGNIAEEILGDTIQLGEGIIGSLALSGQPEFINNTSNDPRSVTIPGTEDQEEERLMIAPLLAGRE